MDTRDGALEPREDSDEADERWGLRVEAKLFLGRWSEGYFVLKET